MIVEQIYTGCLSEASYYIESNGEAAVIDPLRESFPYLERAQAGNAKIKYVFETHFHADFVSGHIDLAQKSGAAIVYGPGADTGYDAINARDGQVFKVGELTIIALHTPGHTMESTTWLLRTKDGKDYCLFTGDTLFIGDVGRPDLAQKGAELTQEDLAGMLFDSLRTKIMPLSDELIIYPAHGAGSACGKKMSSETSATLGDQKKFNYALRADMTRDEFIAEVTEGLAPPPAYFPENVRLNKEGYEPLDEVIQRGLHPMNPQAFSERMKKSDHPLVLDTRTMQQFAAGHIPGSIFIGLDGSFAPWVGSLFPDVERPILLVTEKGREEETVRRLSRVGYDNSLGYLEGSLEAWQEAGKPVEEVTELAPDQFAAHYKAKSADVLDVRKPGEYDAGHIEDSVNSPLDFLQDNYQDIDSSKTWHLHCKGGYRSLIAWSILRSRGFKNLVNLTGGYDALVMTDLPVVQPVG